MSSVSGHPASSVPDCTMNGTFTISETGASDHDAIEALLDVAFGLDRRTKSSYRLREGNVAVPGLSLVARDAEGKLAGTVSFWPLAIGEAGSPALLLGPLAVDPGHQGLGIGLAVMREGLKCAQAQGHGLVILVGDEPEYAKVGFHKLPQGLLIMPGPVNPDRFLYRELRPHTLDGVSGVVLPPFRHAEHVAGLAALAVPRAAQYQEQHAEACERA
jgi:predicted N-acetyltransferase YhbS